MSSGGDGRHGQVFIAPHPHPDWRGAFTAYWDNMTPPFPIEQPPPFVAVEDAIAWGRTRALRVLVRLGDDDTTLYSAGAERLVMDQGPTGGGRLLPEWPP